MTSCLENIQIPPCTWFESGEKRNTIVSMIAGTLVINFPLCLSLYPYPCFSKLKNIILIVSIQYFIYEKILKLIAIVKKYM